MDYTLTMTFINTLGDKVPFSIAGVNPSITEVETSALMDTIITKDIFIGKGGSLASKYNAQLTQRTVTKFNVQ